MRKALLCGTAVALISISSIASAADCDARLRTLNDMEQTNQTRALIGPISNDIRELRNAAWIFAQHGNEEACEEVVAGIEDLVENRREKMAAGEKVDYDSWHQAEIEQLKSAKSLSESQTTLRAGEVIGADLRNMENEDLGEVEDVVLDPKGDIRYAIVAHGGFLGIAEKQIAVPWTSLKVANMENGNRVFVLNSSEEALDEAPSFDRGTFNEVDNEKWRQDIDAYFKDVKG